MLAILPPRRPAGTWPAMRRWSAWQVQGRFLRIGKLLLRPTVETAPEELKLAVHLRGRLAASPLETISIAKEVA